MGTPIVNLKNVVDEAVTGNVNVIAVQDSITEFTDVTVVNETAAIESLAATKTSEYNLNTIAKITDYNLNTVAKLAEYNANHTTKSGELQLVADEVSTSVDDAEDYKLAAAASAQSASTDADTTEANKLVTQADVVSTTSNRLDVIAYKNLAYQHMLDAADSEQIATDARIIIEMLQEVFDTYADLPLTGVVGKTYVVLVDETADGEMTAYRWGGPGAGYLNIFDGLVSSSEVKFLYESNVDTNVFDDAALAKLAALETSSDLDNRDTANRDRANHTGTQSADSIVDSTSFKVMTSAERIKLTAIEAGATGDQSPAEIKAAYESNADTNNYNDAAVAKLGGIEAGATGDQTAGEIKTAYESNADTNAFTNTYKSLVDNTESTTQLNTRDVNNRARSNHTGTQAIATIVGLEEELEKRSYTIGFHNIPNISITFADGTRALTIAANSGTYEMHTADGTRYASQVSDNVALPDVEGLHYIYFDNAGVLQSYTNPNRTEQFDLMLSTLPVSYVYWDAVNNEAIFATDILKGTEMALSTWVKNFYDLDIFGLDGLVISNDPSNGGTTTGDWSVDSGAQFTLSPGELLFTDRKYSTNLKVQTAAWDVLYLENGNLRRYNQTGAIALTDTNLGVGGTGRLVHNDVDGTGNPVAVTNNDFVWYFVGISNNYDPAQRVVAFMGQHSYGTENSANNSIEEEIGFVEQAFSIKQEFALTHAILFQTSNSATNAIKARVINIKAIESTSGITAAASVPADLIEGGETTLHGHSNQLISGARYTESEVEPVLVHVGDEWLVPSTEVLWKRMSDGATEAWVQINGSSGLNFSSTIESTEIERVSRTVTSSTALLDTDLTLFVDATAGNIEVTIPTATARIKQEYNIIRIDNTNNIVNVVPQIGETISGNITLELINYDSLVMVSDNTNWFIR